MWSDANEAEGQARADQGCKQPPAVGPSCREHRRVAGKARQQSGNLFPLRGCKGAPQKRCVSLRSCTRCVSP